jgi:hypothetical protein
MSRNNIIYHKTLAVLLVLTFISCSQKKKVYKKYWFGNYRQFNNECRTDVYKKYGVKFKYVGAKDEDQVKHNEKVEKKLLIRNGEGWQERMEKELQKCPCAIDSLMGW